MKNKIGIIALAAAIVFGAFVTCDNGTIPGSDPSEGNNPPSGEKPLPPPALNISALETKINEAVTEKNNTFVAADANGAGKGQKWVTQDVMTTFTTAIATAQNVRSSAASQTAIDSAVNTLDNALAVFRSAQQEGKGAIILINFAAVSGIHAPTFGAEPNTTAYCETENITVGEVTWSPTVTDTFAARTQYTATVTLTTDENYAFTEYLSATINEYDAEVTYSEGKTATLSYTFPETLDKIVTKIEVLTQPKLTYTHSNTLDLTGLAVILTYDFGAPDEATFADFDQYSITTSPVHNVTLSVVAHNGKSIKVQHGELAAYTDNLIVNKADPAVVTWPVAGSITFGTALSSSILSGGESPVFGKFAWTTPLTKPDAVGSYQYEVTFTPTDTTNYNKLTQNVSVTVTKANPVVTWPSASTITYGAVLSSSILSGGNSAPAGAFAWTDGTIIPIVNNSGYEVTFTPTDNANYNTVKQMVSVTINKANPVVTWPVASTITYENALSASTLSGGDNSVPGKFAWATPTIIPTVSNGYEVTFTPTDTANYNTLAQIVNIIVIFSRTVTFNSNGGSVVATITVNTYGETITEPEPPTRARATFDSWYKESTFINKWNFAADIVTGNITLYARWNFALPLTDVSDVEPYLTTQSTGGSTIDPTYLPVNVDLKSISYTSGPWRDILDGIYKARKYVNLDLSACTMSVDTRFTREPNVHSANGIASIIIFTMPDAVTEIPSSADRTYTTFRSFTMMTHVIIGKNVTTIGEDAFYKNNLTNITFATPSKVTTIGDYAFAFNQLTSVTIPNLVSQIYDYAFQGNQLTSITIGANVKLGSQYNYILEVNSGFETAYNITYNKVGGTYTRPNTSSTVWTRDVKDPIVTWPSASPITYGAALSTSTFSYGTGAGTFAWTAPTTIPTVSNSGYEVTFTPNDTANYNTLKQIISITVNKANPTVTWPTASPIAYGQALSASTLSGGSATPAGTFAWTNTLTIPPVGSNGYEITFTPNNANYNTMTQNVSVTVGYSVTFNSNGGSAVDPTISTPGAIITTPPAPTKARFTFGGWYREAALINKWNFTTDTVTSNIILYAKWDYSLPLTEISYVVPYLATLSTGDSIANPSYLPMQINFGDMSFGVGVELNWQNLLEAIKTANKYVSLDLSACTAYPNFDPSCLYYTKGKELITHITLPDEARRISSKDGIAGFAFFINLTSVIIGNNTTEIVDTAFLGQITNQPYPRLSSVTIGESVQVIGSEAFAFNQLTNVIIPDSVRSIGAGAFAWNQLTSVTIGNNVTTIEYNAFSNNKLTSITIGANVNMKEDAFADGEDRSSETWDSGFEAAYNNTFGKAAGTYTRSSTSSTTWTKLP